MLAKRTGTQAAVTEVSEIDPSWFQAVEEF
jgi:hypothetical protein